MDKNKIPDSRTIEELANQMLRDLSYSSNPTASSSFAPNQDQIEVRKCGPCFDASGIPGDLRLSGGNTLPFDKISFNTNVVDSPIREMENLYFLDNNIPGEYYFIPSENLSRPAIYNSADIFDINIIRRDFPVLSQKVNGKPLIWFDNAATTQKPNCVINSITEYYSTINSNIHRGVHTLATKSTEAYESARSKIRNFIGAASPDEIILVRGCTEGINLIANTYGKKMLTTDDEILLPELEHHANIIPWQMVSKLTGAKIVKIPINERGEIIIEEYHRLLGPRTKIVAISQVSNALGTITPVKEMTELAHRFGAVVLIDGAQAVAHQRVNVQEIGCDFYAFSGHKIYGPTGIGAVYGRKELLELMPPWQGGGNMIKEVSFDETTYNEPPAKFEAGTPNIADAVGLGFALDYVTSIGLENISKYEHGLTNYAIDLLAGIPKLRLIGTAREKISVLSFVIEGIDPNTIGKYFDSEGIAVRTGHHCAQPSLRRFGLSSTVRPSLAMYNTFDEIDFMIEKLKGFMSQIR